MLAHVSARGASASVVYFCEMTGTSRDKEQDAGRRRGGFDAVVLRAYYSRHIRLSLGPHRPSPRRLPLEFAPHPVALDRDTHKLPQKV